MENAINQVKASHDERYPNSGEMGDWNLRTDSPYELSIGLIN